MFKARVKSFQDLNADAIRRMVTNLGGLAEVHIGVLGADAEKTYENGMTVGDVAIINHLGLGGDPPRPWLTQFMDAQAGRMANDAKAGFQQVVQDYKSRSSVMNFLGKKWSEQLQGFVRSGNVRPALAPSTIWKKGHAIPLIESELFVQSIGFKVKLSQWKSVPTAVRQMVGYGGK